MKTAISKFVFLASIAFAGSAATLAHATDDLGQTTSCVASKIQYVNDGFAVQCANTGVFYSVFGPSNTACTHKQSSDSVKALLSMAQASYLAGKPMTVNFYTTSGGTNNGCLAGAKSVVLFELD